MKILRLLVGWLPIRESTSTIYTGVEYIPLNLNEKGIWIDSLKFEKALLAYSQEAFIRASKNRKYTTWGKFLNELDNISEAIYHFVKHRKTKDRRIEMISQFYGLDPTKGDIICFVNRAKESKGNTSPRAPVKPVESRE